VHDVIIDPGFGFAKKAEASYTLNKPPQGFQDAAIADTCLAYPAKQ